MMVEKDAGEVRGGTGAETFSARDAMLAWMQKIAPYGIFTTDAELRIQSWNEWLVTHSGLLAEKVIGRLVVEVFPEVQSRCLDEQFRRALSGEISVLSTALHKYLLPFPTPAVDYDVPHMLQTVRIAPLSAGELIVGTITIIEDVTQRESQARILNRQQEHDRLLSAALGTLLQSNDPLRDVAAIFPQIAPPLGLDVYLYYIFDADTGVLRLNSAGGISPAQKEAMAVLPLGEGLCGQCARVRQPLLRTQLQSSRDAAAQAMRGLGMRSYCCFPLLIGDRLLGTMSFASYSRDAIAPDEVSVLSAIAHHIASAMDRGLREAALRAAQQSLREHAETLETKIAERTARLHETIAQLESFSYTVAHDLRAPIRGLKGYCDILLSDYIISGDGRDLVERMQRASNRLDALTRDLLQFSKISRQNVQLAPVDVIALVQDIVAQTSALQNNIVMVHPPLGAVWAQRTLLQQCLSNLFENAAKFVAPGTTPRIVVRMERRETAPSSHTLPFPKAFNPATRNVETAAGRPGYESGESASENPPRLRIWVEDNGIGIPPDAHEKIFGIFERVSGLDQFEGTGIGLAIVARAVQQMSGACGVESTPGDGSRFWLEFWSAENAVTK